MQTGILMQTPHGTNWWHKCKDARTGYAEMASIAFTYGEGVFNDPRTVFDFGTSDGETFTPTERIRPRGA